VEPFSFKARFLFKRKEGEKAVINRILGHDEIDENKEVKEKKKNLLVLVVDNSSFSVDVGPQVVLGIDVLPNARLVHLVRDVDGVGGNLHDVPVGKRDGQVSRGSHAE
jgi:hypothetical protein